MSRPPMPDCPHRVRAEGGTLGLSIVIPALRIDDALVTNLASLRLAARHASLALNFVVSVCEAPVNRPNRHRSPDIAVIRGPKGRGRQIEAGFRAARAGWVLILHADTRLGEGWAGQVYRWIAMQRNTKDLQKRAAYFRFCLDDRGVWPRTVEWAVRWRCRLLALPYGDQGLLVHTSLLHEVGSLADYDLMEDVVLVRRIGRARLGSIAVPAITSAERYRQDGYFRRIARNSLCLFLFFLGVSVPQICRIYQR